MSALARTRSLHHAELKQGENVRCERMGRDFTVSVAQMHGFDRGSRAGGLVECLDRANSPLVTELHSPNGRNATSARVHQLAGEASATTSPPYNDTRSRRSSASVLHGVALPRWTKLSRSQR